MLTITKLVVVRRFIVGIFAVASSAFSCLAFSVTDAAFKTPADQYYPMPFWHINGEMTKEGIKQQLINAKTLGGFKGVAILPVAQTQPEYLSEAYFDMYRYILDTAKSMDMKVIIYDDTGFPSGTAGGKIEKNHLHFTRKALFKHEIAVKTGRNWRIPIPGGTLMATVGMNMETFERVDLAAHVDDRFLEWKIPEGDWKIFFFTTDIAPYFKGAFPVDYLNPDAVNQFIEYTYQDYANRFSNYFGDTVEVTFFDDVGFLWLEKTWTDKFNEKFKSLYGKDAAIYYPALWYDIGPETEAARVALFNTRAELLAEGYPKQVHEWSKKHGLKSTGHPPGNYGIQAVDMHGDIFKFYRYTDYPLMDYIIKYGRGRDGFKLISSAATLYDKPIVATEIYGAFPEESFDKNMLYRAMMELFVRGVNFVVPHGMWYDWENVRIPPLVSAESGKLVADLPAYSDYVARSSYLLRGGKTVADIAVVYPITSLQGAYYFDEPTNKVPGDWAYPEADYQKISGMLSLDIRRDFTFVHPEYLATEKYAIKNSQLHLNNQLNPQSYSVLILPGGKVMSVAAMQKIKQFYDNGGKVIATTLLPSRSAEFGQDETLASLVTHIFGKDARNQAKGQKNANGGRAVFIADPSAKKLAATLTQFAPAADVIFSKPPKIKSELGVFSYMHKVRDGKNLYLFANSSDVAIDTDVLLWGERKLAAWDPHSGQVSPPMAVEKVNHAGQPYSKLKLKLGPVSSMFWVSVD